MVKAHANALYPILSDPALHTFTGDSPPRSEAALAEVYARRESRRSPDGDELWLNWLIQERELGIAVGYAQATISLRQTLVAWVIAGPWQRRGYGSKAAQGLMAWLRRCGFVNQKRTVPSQPREAVHEAASLLARPAAIGGRCYLT
jgi:RimJ/RimL family protein N-acetyltransferase